MGREARAHASTTTADLAGFVLTLPITKVDAEKRLVTGIATAENLDKQGEIVDYPTAKAFFTNADVWPGNIREMHQPKAVGKAVEVECDDANKTISVTARISKGAPETWEKVIDGTLSMYSIGGSGKRVVEKQGDKTVKRLFLEQLAEVSLVDNGANPLAKFEIVKSVDGKLADAQPADPDEDPISKATEALDAALDAAAELVTKSDEAKHKTASGQEGKWYAGTDGKSFPITTARDVHNAARDIGRTTQDRAKVKANIIRIAHAHGLESGLPDAWKKKDDSSKAVEANDVTKSGPEPYDIDGALQAISFVNRLMTSEYWEARSAAYTGSDDGPEKSQVLMLKAALDALLEFLQSEYEEQFTDDAGVTRVPAFSLMDTDAAVEMFAKSLAVVQKAGARHSKGDLDMIQKGHDLMKSLGAVCKEDDMSSSVEMAVKPPVDTKTEPMPTEPTDVIQTADVQKLTADLDLTKTLLTESQATVAKHAETVAALEARVKAIEAQPMPGGPVKSAHAIEKTLGGPSSEPAPELATEAVSKVLADLASKATTDEERMRIITKNLEYRRAIGLDRLDPISGRSISAT